LPFVLLDGLRNTLTAPVSSSHFMTRLFGMSLQSRKRPSPNHNRSLGPPEARREALDRRERQPIRCEARVDHLNRWIRVIARDCSASDP